MRSFAALSGLVASLAYTGAGTDRAGKQTRARRLGQPDPLFSKDCDPMTRTNSSATPAHPSAEQRRLARHEEKYRHELMSEDERCELRDRILRLRRKLRVSR
jgi:hypothetical protein